MYSKNTYYYPRSEKTPSSVTVIKAEGLTDAQRMLVVSLQGLVAKTMPEIYIDYSEDSYESRNCMVYLEALINKYGLTVSYENDIFKLIERYKPCVEGYILTEYPCRYMEKYDCEMPLTDSLNVATSMAGLKKSVIVDESLEAEVKAMGLVMTFDARGKNVDWLIKQPEYDRLNKKLCFELGRLDYIRDYAIMCNGICFFSLDHAHYEARQKIFEDCDRDTPVFGWGNAQAGENDFTQPLTDAGHFWAAGRPANLSYITAFSKEQSVKQKPLNENVEEKDGNHYVAFVISDGDSLQFAYNGYVAGEGRLYDSKARGRCSLGWGVPAALTEVAPDVLEVIYDKASNSCSSGYLHNDGFISYSSGGYMYPSTYPADLLDNHIEKLMDSMRRSDTRILGIIDFDRYVPEALPLWDKYTRHEQVDGIFYIDFCSYATDSDTILWSNSKPVIASRARFWQGLPQSDISYIANKLNNMPAELKNPNTYSLVMVHCWSKTVNEVVELTKHLDSHVRVVTPQTLVRLVTKYVDRSWVSTRKTAPNKLEYVIDTGDFTPEQTVKYSGKAERLPAELHYAPFANSPAGKAKATKYILDSHAYAEHRFTNPNQLSPDASIELALFQTMADGDVRLQLFDTEGKDILDETIVFDFTGWKFFSFKLDKAQKVTLGGYRFTAKDSLVDFCIDEFVVRGGIGRNITAVSSTVMEKYELKPGQTAALNPTRKMWSFEEFYASGAIFYTPVSAAVDQAHLDFRYSVKGKSVNVSPDGIVTAVKPEISTVTIESRHYNQSPLYLEVNIIVTE